MGVLARRAGGREEERVRGQGGPLGWSYPFNITAFSFLCFSIPSVSCFSLRAI